MIKQNQFVTPLLAWYDENKREMVWRDKENAYYTWISEIMLQQTRIEAAKEYFVRFTTELPDIQSLAMVPQERLLKLWEGLGYYNRAKNLQKTAQILVKEYEAKLPEDYEKLLKLPGIGPYTAGAIASIAYGIKVPAVDGNVLRVMMRYQASLEDITKMSVRRRVEKELTEVMPERPGDFNQAIMELGEVICIPNGTPLCEQCPLAQTCEAKKQGEPEKYPQKVEKKPRKIEKKTILIFEKEGKYGIARRDEKGLLAGLYEFPSFVGHFNRKKLEEKLEAMGLKFKDMESLGAAKHIFSHIEWHMKGYLIFLADTCEKNNLTFASLEEIEDKYSLPTAFRAYKEKLRHITEE
ncbi:MAG: A/G-specific adenine glycosylase [Eubacterium sp.]